jgi:3-vinyl bacteriochlorophyllide hydratase
LDSSGLMYLALAAYATYVVNAAQFIWKLRMARLGSQLPAIITQSSSSHVELAR